jgi:hypothetical protein
MKYFIVGLHSSGKQDVVNLLNEYNIKCGKIFSNLESPHPEIYNSENYEYYSDEDINNIFENDAYVFMQEIPDIHPLYNTKKYYEGLSKYTLDQNEVFIISPDQLLSISPNSIKDDICFIWIDNTRNNRTIRYKEEKRLYNYKNRDIVEQRDINSFVKILYSFNRSNILYFTDEDPARIATIIHTIIKHPDTFDMFVKNFN